jgi:hypothetical protein
MTLTPVMAGIDPGHPDQGRNVHLSEIAGTSPAMTTAMTFGSQT